MFLNFQVFLSKAILIQAEDKTQNSYYFFRIRLPAAILFTRLTGGVYKKRQISIDKTFSFIG